MTRIAKMGSLWNFTSKDGYEDNGQAMLCQVDNKKYAMIIIKGSGKGNRWCNPVKIDPIKSVLHFTDEQWNLMVGAHYNFVEAI